MEPDVFTTHIRAKARSLEGLLAHICCSPSLSPCMDRTFHPSLVSPPLKRVPWIRGWVGSIHAGVRALRGGLAYLRVTSEIHP